MVCDDPGGLDDAARKATLLANCECDVEQHYQYRWDALNRLDEARRYDRGDGRSTWELQVRQQYQYDGGNVRRVKRTRDGFSYGAGQNGQDGIERVALYAMPGDFERRGLTTGALSYDASLTLGTETQYLISGTRLVWKGAAGGVTPFNRDMRLTATVPDLLQSAIATIDLVNGELLERGTYLPTGVRETLATDQSLGTFALEPVGFTGKEGDDEVGLIYFGERYLMPHLGRWASPDPLQVHAGGGGEFGNSFHYVGGNLLQARDPNGLDILDVARGAWESAPSPLEMVSMAANQVLESAAHGSAAIDAAADGQWGRAASEIAQTEPIVRMAVSVHRRVGEVETLNDTRQTAATETERDEAAGRQILMATQLFAEAIAIAYGGRLARSASSGSPAPQATASAGRRPPGTSGRRATDPLAALTEAEINGAVNGAPSAGVMIEAPAPTGSRFNTNPEMMANEHTVQSTTSAAGGTGNVATRIRVHTADPGAPAGSNSGTGNSVTITQGGGNRRMTPDGQWHQTSTATSDVMNRSHIPIHRENLP